MRRNLVYWAATALFCLPLGASGLMYLLGADAVVEGVHHLGFPGWFVGWLGLWKVAGVAVLLAPGLPRLKEWAYAGFVVNVSSAALAHHFAGDGAAAVASPLVLGALLLTSWATRPASRQLEVDAALPLQAHAAK